MKNSGYAQAESLKDVDDTKETVHSFLDKINQAKLAGDDWVETTPQVISHYNRNGLNGAKFFIFQGIKVCEHGKIEEIESEYSRPIANRLHGDKEGTTNI